jgi:hypothetical protein
MTAVRLPRWVATAAVAVGVATVAGACGSNATYVSSDKDNAFFRLPTGYTVFDIDTRPQAADRPQAQQSSIPPSFQKVFDRSASPSKDNIQVDKPADPVGRMSVFYVSASSVDELSPQAVRSATSGLGDDPLTVAQSQPNKVEIVRFDRLNEGALSGSRVVFNNQLDSGGWVTKDLTTLIDPRPHTIASGAQVFKVYLLDIRCEAGCFKANRPEIDKIVQSFQVRG